MLMARSQERPVSHLILTVPKAYIELTGDHVSALALARISFYGEIGKKDDEGYFKLPDEVLVRELLVSLRQLRRIREQLEPLGLATTERGTPPTTYYRLPQQFSNYETLPS